MCPLAGTWMDRASVCVREVREKKEGGGGKEVWGMKEGRGEGRGRGEG